MTRADFETLCREIAGAFVPPGADDESTICEQDEFSRSELKNMIK